MRLKYIFFRALLRQADAPKIHLSDINISLRPRLQVCCLLCLNWLGRAAVYQSKILTITNSNSALLNSSKGAADADVRLSDIVIRLCRMLLELRKKIWSSNILSKLLDFHSFTNTFPSFANLIPISETYNVTCFRAASCFYSTAGI